MAGSQGELILSYLSPTAQEDLAHLVEHSDELPKIAELAAALDPSVGFSGAATVIESETGTPSADAHRLLWTIWNLHSLGNRFRLPTEELLRTTFAVLEGRVSDPAPAAWEKAKAPIAEFLGQLSDSHPLVVAKKAERLGLDHQNLLSEARFVTDIRPVFDSSGNKILESLVMQTLIVDYSDGHGTRRIEFALDADDVSQLRRLCERAEHKALTLKKDMGCLPWSTEILGEQNPSDAQAE